MSIPLRVLILEDSQFDAELMVAELRRAGYEPDWVRVETEEDYKTQLESKYDIVLADYRLPKFNGVGAVSLLDRAREKIPLIIVSGTIGDEEAAGIIKLGAADFLLKDRMARLGPAVRQALIAREQHDKLLRAQEALRQSEERSRVLWETTTDAVILIGADSRIEFANPAVKQVFGHAPEEVTGKDVSILQPARLRDAHRRGLKTYLETGVKTFDWRAKETVGLHRQGHEFPIEIVFSHVTIGNKPLFAGFIRDITERMLAEKKLRASEAQLRSFVDQAPASIAMFDGNMICLAASRHWVAHYGRGQQDLVGLSHYEVHPDMPEEWREIHRKGLAGESQRREEDLWIQADGTRNWLRWAVQPWRDIHGGIGGIMILAEDITERKHIEEEIRETKNFLASIFDNIPNSIFVKDARDLRFVRVNSACEKLTGYSEKEFLGKSDYDFFPKDQADFFVAKDRETLAGKQRVFMVEETITSKDGTEKLLQTKKFPILDKDGLPKFLLGMSEDITARKRAEQSLLERAQSAALGADVGIALTQGETMEAMLQLCCEAIVQHLHAAFARIWTLNERDDMLELRASAGMYVHLDGPHGRVPVGKFKIGLIAQERKAHLTNQVVGDPRVGDQEWARREGMVAFAGYPLLVEDHVVGVVAMFARSPLADVTLQGLASISNNIALGIERKQAEARIRESEAKYRGLIEQASDGIFVSDTKGNYLLVNARGCELLGYAERELVGMNAKKTYLEEEKEIHTERLEQIRSGKTLRFERMVKRKDGSTFPAEISLKMLDNDTLQAIFHDISIRRKQEQKIARLNRIQAVLSGINSAIVRIRDRRELFQEACRIIVEHGGFNLGWIAVLDHATGKLVAAAQAGLPETLGADSAFFNGSVGLVPAGVAVVALREKRFAIDNVIEDAPGLMDAKHEAGTFKVRRAALELGAKSVIVLPLVVERKTFGILTLYAPERDFFDDEEIKLLNELAGDISFSLEFIAKEERVDYLAYYDALTGLPNRSLFFDRLGHQLGAARRDRTGVALVLIDLDRFRLVNDTLGRQAGDALLEAVAKRLNDAIRGQDSVARVGSNRFALAVSGISDSAEVARALETRSEALFGKSFIVGHEELRVLATSGVAMFPGDGHDPESLFANAEAALRKAKAENLRFLFYSPEINAQVADSLRLENKLRRALANGELVLWYQPKVGVKTRKFAGFEALMRWQDPESGMVPPVKFIPLMEQTGLILEAGRWALSQAAKDCRRWTMAGVKPLRIAVNVSPLQLRQKDFVDIVIGAADEMADAGGALDLEITESTIMESVEAIIPKLQIISGRGVETYVDDFGTGYSSLAYIARLPIHSLKIDRSFVVGMTQNQDSLNIVRSVISMAHALRLHVVAEGVETEDQAALLQQLECDVFQGYLFSRPVPPDEVPELVKRLS